MNAVKQPLWRAWLAIAAAVVLMHVNPWAAGGAEAPSAGGGDGERLACLEAIASATADQEPVRATEDERSQIINRCLAQTGEFGAAMVRSCAEKDLASYETLLAYPEACAPFVVRCAKRLGQHSWGMVKICVDRQVAGDQEQED